MQLPDRSRLDAFLRRLADRPLIAAVKEPKQLEEAMLYSDALAGVFLLTGHIGTVKGYVDLLRRRELPVFLHLERIGGISPDAAGIAYIASAIKPAGIITTKTSVVRMAAKAGLVTVQRFFLVDSDCLDNLANSLRAAEPDMIELMPARMPELIPQVKRMSDKPVIAGGLVNDVQQAAGCLAGGAAGVSTSNGRMWRMHEAVRTAAETAAADSR